ncbi:MAG: hypothetical protein LBV72_02115 [Tannerella sp.]|nr:hypothetical protein [Tannerella sp.]
MKNIILLMLLFIPFFAEAQRQTEYNRKGDEAMKQMDYQIAKFWYEEGVLDCDRYSIDQLTSIWMADESMRISMEPVMNRCLTCLTEAATERKDTLAMNKLIVYYTEGIGTSPNESSATYWKEQLGQFRTPFYQRATVVRERKPKDPMKFFAGYHLSFAAPYGVQMGAMNETWGFYVRFRTNMSFHSDSQVECINGDKGTGIIPEFVKDGTLYEFLKKDDTPVSQNPDKNEKVKGKSSSFIATAGFMLKAFPNTYISVGAGYVERNVFYRYGKINPTASEGFESYGWAKNTDVSIQGVALDVDATVKFAKNFYGSVGCTFLNIEKVTPTIGIGYTF